MAADSLLPFIENRFHGLIRARSTLAAEGGQAEALPPDLDPRLAAALEREGLTRLYSHQAETFRSVAGGADTLIVSRTAGGKTLAFLLPILDAYLKARAPFGVLLLYPTKALSRDQEGKLGRLLEAATGSRALGTFDGDTPREERARLQKGADFIITNPDMLHSGILPNHNRAWRTFLARLRFVVVDEVHSYRGAFGSHVANVFRRLLRAAAVHGGAPVFIGSSATIGNPAEHAAALFGRPVRVVDRDGSPRPARELYFVNPPLVTGPEGVAFRKGPSSISVPLIRKAAEEGVRTICFCRARQEVERLHRAVLDGHPDLAAKVRPYRGGLLPSERRALERDLFEGRTTVVISTSALELGIDIGDLDLCILSGHPGSTAAFWQRAGRVGRKQRRSVVVFVARDTPVDQYIARHPDYITQAPVERAWLSADNPYIILQHLPCAAHEHPLRPEEPLFAGAAYEQAVKVLAANKTLAPYKGMHRYALEDYPARGVNLRGMTDHNVEIHCGTEVIGELDPLGARGTLYKDAIYQHLGRRYLSLDLDLERKLCHVEPVDVDYFTEAVWESRVELTEEEQAGDRHGARLRFGLVNVNRQPKMYKKIRERSFENIGYGPITLPAFVYDTTGFALQPAPAWKEALDAADRRLAGAAMYGLAYILKRTAPSLCMGDPEDIDTDVALAGDAADPWKSSLFLYDAIEGGVGYAEKIFERLEDALALCLRILEECECRMGCPACVPPLPPGVQDADMESFLVESNASTESCKSLLRHLLDGTVTLPKVEELAAPSRQPPPPPPEDPEAVRLRQRLERSAGILQRKRERLH